MAHINPARLFFDLPPLNDADADNKDSDVSAFDSYEIEVSELSSPQDSPGTVIDTVRITPGQDWIETALISSEFSWFLLTIKNEAGDATLVSKVPQLSEKTFLKISYRIIKMPYCIRRIIITSHIL